MEPRIKENSVFANDSDTNIWLEIKAGNRLAFSHLYGRYSKELFQYGYHWTNDKSLIEDVIHDVFVNIWMRREQLSQIQSMKAYLIACIRHDIIRKLSKEKKFELNFNYPGDFDQVRAISEPSLKGEMNDEEDVLEKKMHKVISQLTSRQREVIHLRFYQNLNYEEISRLLGIDIKHAHNVASKAYASIKRYLFSASECPS